MNVPTIAACTQTVTCIINYSWYSWSLISFISLRPLTIRILILFFLIDVEVKFGLSEKHTKFEKNLPHV